MRKLILAAALLASTPALAKMQVTDGSAKECQNAIGFYKIAVDESKKAHELSEFKTIDDLNNYVDNLRATAYANETEALRSMIHAVDELHCANLDESFTNYLMMDIVNTRHYADEMEKKLTPTLLHQGGESKTKE
jgi:hypothetical protein